ncbi:MULTISPECIES: response regulator transcription factor [Roseobacteraceae]|uniref:response regulator transcription factor n=1 Tax=Roseobacteraceae TaxID=2854170 RepID=UPI0031E0733C
MTRELQETFRVHIVDDDDSVRRALSRLLKSTGLDVRAHSSGEELLIELSPQTPACAILDMYLPKMNGFELKQKISALSPSLPVIFLTGRGDIGMSVAAMKEGAFDFLTKPVKPQQLLTVIAAAKKRVAESESSTREAARYEERLQNLTRREAEVMEAVVAGDLNKQIAHDLGLAEKTVKVHRARVMKKMGVRSVAELVRVSVTKRIDLS